MKRLVARCLPIIALALMAQTANAREVHVPTLSKILKGTAGIVIPASWAGVWTFADTTRECGSPDTLGTDAGLDTLCAGDAVAIDDQGIPVTCSGTATDTQVDVTCTGGFSFPGCAFTITIHVQATRNGNTVTYLDRTSTTFVPTGCAGQDECKETSGKSVRTGQPPPTCSTAVRKSSWGSLKQLYR